MTTFFTSKKQWFEYSDFGILNTNKKYTWTEFKKIYKMLPGVMFGCRFFIPGKDWFADESFNMFNRINTMLSNREITPDDVTFDKYIDTEKIIMNGEITYSGVCGGVYCFGSTLPNLPMRPALKLGGRNISRIELKCLIGEEIYDELMEIVMTYDEQTIEFSVFGNPVGRFLSRLHIWEIRGSY